MKSGNNKSKDLFEKRINKEFKDYHNEESCAGKWSVIHRDDFPYKLDTRMFVTIKHAPFVHCSDCGASYFVPGFEDWIQKRIAVEILRQESIISKPSLRYLRTLTGKTQKEMGEFLGINKEDSRTLLYYIKEQIEDKEVRFPSTVRWNWDVAS